MLLKRLYDTPDGWVAERDADGRVTNAPPLKGLRLYHTGTNPAQNFSRRMVDTGLAEGWLTLGKGLLMIDTEQETLEYTIVRTPGTYCCHCDARLEDDPSGASGRAHVTQAHAGTPSPDPSNPAGFRVTSAYECTLNEAQHALWNGQAHAARMAKGEAAPQGRKALPQQQQVPPQAPQQDDKE